MLKGIRLPIRWPALGFPPVFEAGGVAVADGMTAWHWSANQPGWRIESFFPERPVAVPGWRVDHVVILVPDIDVARLDLSDAGLRHRRAGKVRGQPALFYRAGPVLEVIEHEVPEPEIYGVALSTDEDLDAVVERWRSSGIRVTDPTPAVQPHRRIAVVKDMEAGLAVMTPDVTKGRT